MPIYVQVPGGKLDTAGQGFAAAQQYRSNEREMKRRDQLFELEKETALRKVAVDEQQLEFEQEQLASAQEAEADALLGMAIESGQDIGDQGAYKQMLMRTSPRFRSQMATELGRATRLRAEQAAVEEIAGEIENTPKTQARVQSGELTDPGAIKRAMSAERREIAQLTHQEMARANALEAWQTWTKDPGFDMPEETDEAYGDVMDILGELTDGSNTNPKTNYHKLADQLVFLTTKGMRQAAMDLLQRDLGGVDVRGLPKGAVGDATAGTDFQQRAAADYVDKRGDAAQAERNADDPGYAARRAKANTAAGNAPKAAPKAAAADGKIPTENLPVPAGVEKPKSVAEMPAQAVTATVPEDKAALARTALSNLGMKEVPPKGTPERAKLAAEIKRLEKERGSAEHDARVKETLSKPGGHL